MIAARHRHITNASRAVIAESLVRLEWARLTTDLVDHDCAVAPGALALWPTSHLRVEACDRPEHPMRPHSTRQEERRRH